MRSGATAIVCLGFRPTSEKVRIGARRSLEEASCIRRLRFAYSQSSWVLSADSVKLIVTCYHDQTISSPPRKTSIAPSLSQGAVGGLRDDLTIFRLGHLSHLPIFAFFGLAILILRFGF